MTRNGDVKKLFPLPVHGTTQVTNPETGLQVPLIDTPAGMLDNGSVVEPNVSEDGTRVIFAYFHDATPSASIPSNQGGMSKRGADLYVMDMTALLADPTVNPALLPVKRLTFRIYDGTGAQADADKNKNAMNQAVVNNGNNGWGTVYMHGTEMRTSDGLKLVYVSGEKRLMNSNDQRGWPNYNLNLNIADIKADGSLGAKRQWQYYTTTSALSPTPLPEGVAITYQATTGDGRNWQIQRIDSVGRWKPLIGYGSNPDLFHLGAYCVATAADSHGNQPGDYFVAVRYCGGCHQHVEGLGLPFAGTVAAGQRALDMVTQTQTVTYDGLCNPVLVVTPNATERLPEWKQDVWPGLNTHCSSCHTGTGSGTAVFSYTDEQTAYNALASNNYANSVSGALGSPAFWAARGERTDGRNNALYATTSPPYKLSSVHATTPGLCVQNDPVKAEWVRKLGQWIDNHMPRNTSGNFPADKDTYHPTVDGAVYDASCAGARLRVGFWDDSGVVQSVQVFKNGVSIGGPWGPLPNGTQDLLGLSIANADVIKVIAEDADHNRQWYEKTGKQLKSDCQVTLHLPPVMQVP